MDSSLDRKKTIARYALPPQDSVEYKAMEKWMNAYQQKNPKAEKEIKIAFETAIKIITAQGENGAGLPMDNEIRKYAREFNGRAFDHGLRSMPTSYNVLEAFFQYSPKFNFFEILEEENYIISFYDFVDFITSKDFEENNVVIEDFLLDDMIYHYDISNDLEEITFSNDSGKEFVIGGVSLVKRGNEVVVLILNGLKENLTEKNKELEEENEYIPTPGKENIKPDPNLKQEAVPLFDKQGYWKSLAFCRFDLTTKTIDVKFVQMDWGDRFTVLTDDSSIFLDMKGKPLHEFDSEYFQNYVKQLSDYTPLFDIAMKCLYLPYYFDSKEELISVEEHPTSFIENSSKPLFRRDKLVPSRYKIKNRQVYKLDEENRPKADLIQFGDNEFHVERNGYWKTLPEHNAKGKNKAGEPIQGKTWVEQTITWYEESSANLVVNIGSKRYSESLNAGYIYLLRNASLAPDIYKIGLTRRAVDTRAKELGATSGVVDKFLIAAEWEVKDCVVAEALIHERLKDYRVNPKREFFKILYKDAMAVIQQVIDEINSK
ncbi:MAG: GIY-YIG nuclease family protein [Taibaiella sp.]|jgi:hypothetical protein